MQFNSIVTPLKTNIYNIQSPQMRQLTVSTLMLLDLCLKTSLPSLIANTYTYYVLIISSTQDPVHIPWLISHFNQRLQSLGYHRHEFISVLCKLWEHMVDPVTRVFNDSNVHPGSRIWRCPTAQLTLLPPPHATLLERKKANLSHIYIFYNTPTPALSSCKTAGF